MTSLRSRRLLAALTTLLAFATTACAGGDSIPDDPAEDAGAGVPAPAGDDPDSLGGDGVEEPAPGANQPLPETDDDL